MFLYLFFRARFHPQYSEKDAARAMIEVVEAACLNFRYSWWLLHMRHLYSQNLHFLLGHTHMMSCKTYSRKYITTKRQTPLN